MQENLNLESSQNSIFEYNSDKKWKTDSVHDKKFRTWCKHFSEARHWLKKSQKSEIWSTLTLVDYNTKKSEMALEEKWKVTEIINMLSKMSDESHLKE